ncbi:hypothetical protein Goari_000459 [Gossypium aridum]|uniref:CCHC-type domain-containing protein n=1 Tax=Gossypium aridum TaxID=34290 RepID=A0A7J8YGQ6_GOSAI|nr:hypothetical protein [Gossypium aridum]
MMIPLIYSPSWVQIHDVPIGFVSENLAIQMGNFIGEFMEYDGSNMGKEGRNFMRIRVRLDIRRPLKRKKQIKCHGKCSYVRFRYERLSLFCFFCGRLGHSDSFCEARMELGMEAKEMGWDLSLRAQSRRAQTMTSVWLREESEGQGGSRNVERHNRGANATGLLERRGNWEFLDPVLGINLTGKEYYTAKGNGNWSGNLDNNSMEHDLEDEVIVGEEGKKRNRREMEDGSRGGLCLAWRAGKNVQLQNFSKRHIDVIIDEVEKGYKWRFTGFYGSPYPHERAEAWNVLRHLRTARELPWLVCGDFNEIMYSFEKKGGLPREEGRMEVFRKTLEDCSLSDLGFIGNWFTWERGNFPENNIQERLDRGEANEEWNIEKEYKKISNLKLGGCWRNHS